MYTGIIGVHNIVLTLVAYYHRVSVDHLLNLFSVFICCSAFRDNVSDGSAMKFYRVTALIFGTLPENTAHFFSLYRQRPSGLITDHGGIFLVK